MNHCWRLWHCLHHGRFLGHIPLDCCQARHPELYVSFWKDLEHSSHTGQDLNYINHILGSELYCFNLRRPEPCLTYVFYRFENRCQPIWLELNSISQSLQEMNHISNIWQDLRHISHIWQDLNHILHGAGFSKLDQSYTNKQKKYPFILVCTFGAGPIPLNTFSSLLNTNANKCFKSVSP